MATSPGYPGSYPNGIPITGLDRVETGPDLQVFHSGTARSGNEVITAGGRVLATCALGDNLEAARSNQEQHMEGIVKALLGSIEGRTGAVQNVSAVPRNDAPSFSSFTR